MPAVAALGAEPTTGTLSRRRTRPADPAVLRRAEGVRRARPGADQPAADAAAARRNAPAVGSQLQREPFAHHPDRLVTGLTHSGSREQLRCPRTGSRCKGRVVGVVSTEGKPKRMARGIPDTAFNELFTALPSDPDRALIGGRNGASDCGAHSPIPRRPHFTRGNIE